MERIRDVRVGGRHSLRKLTSALEEGLDLPSLQKPPRCDPILPVLPSDHTDSRCSPVTNYFDPAFI